MKVQSMTFALLLIPIGLDPLSKKAPLYGYFSSFVPLNKPCAIRDRIFKEAQDLITDMYGEEEANIAAYSPSIRTIKDYSPHNGKKAWVLQMKLDNVVAENGRTDLSSATIITEDAIGYKIIDVNEMMPLWESPPSID